MAAVLDGGGISSKVTVPTSAGIVIAAVMSVLAAFDITIPIDQDQILAVVSATLLIWSTISGFVAYYTTERNPSKSAIDLVRRAYAQQVPASAPAAPGPGQPGQFSSAVAAAQAQPVVQSGVVPHPAERQQVLPSDRPSNR